MSIEAMVWALEQQSLEPVEKLTLLGIANHADRYGGNAYPSLATLALYVGRGEQTVRRAVANLIERGLVEVSRQAGGSEKLHGGYRPNLYRLNLARTITDDTPSEERDITGDRAGVSPATGQGYQGYVSRTVPQPSENLLSEFELFWSSYPRRVGKLDALKAFEKARRLTDLDTIVVAVRRLVAEGREMRFVPHPATWLRQGRWDDETEEEKPVVETPIPVFCGTCWNGWLTLRSESGSEYAERCPCIKSPAR